MNTIIYLIQYFELVVLLSCLVELPGNKKPQGHKFRKVE